MNACGHESTWRVELWGRSYCPRCVKERLVTVTSAQPTSPVPPEAASVERALRRAWYEEGVRRGWVDGLKRAWKEDPKEKKMEQDTRKDLHELRERLLKYCHEEGCDSYHLCPRGCKCSKELDLGTSIVWECRTLVSSILGLGHSEFAHAAIAEALLHVLSRHEKEYQDAWELVRDTRDLAIISRNS